MSTSEENKAAVWACFETGAEGSLEALDEILSAHFVLHDPSSPEDVRGIEGMRALIEMYRSGIPDLRITIEHQFSEGDYVATRWTARGTHEGEIMGAPASGRGVTLTGITISRCSDGMIVEKWEVSDVFGLLQQIKAPPEMAAS